MTTTPQPRRRRRRTMFALTTLALLLLLAACTGSDDASSDTDDASSAATGSAGSADDGAEFGLGEAEATAAAAPADAEDAAADDAGDTDEPSQLPVDATGTAATGERIIKEGTVTLQVQPGEFDEAFSHVIVRAQELGGHVAGSSSSTEPVPAREEGEHDGVLVSGQVTIRVPVRAFEDLLTAIGGAGEIIDRNVTSQDVTAEFTDLESRRRHLQAQERFYLGLLEQAASVPDAIAVQQQLDGIQGQIEEITGRLNLLSDRTSFSTLTVRIREQGAEPIDLAEEAEPTGLTPYLRDAADVFIATIGSIIVVATFLAPIVVLLLIAVGVWRMVRPVRRRQRDGHPAPLAADPHSGDRDRQPAAVGGPGPDGPPTG